MKGGANISRLLLQLLLIWVITCVAGADNSLVVNDARYSATARVTQSIPISGSGFVASMTAILYQALPSEPQPRIPSAVVQKINVADGTAVLVLNETLDYSLVGRSLAVVLSPAPGTSGVLPSVRTQITDVITGDPPAVTPTPAAAFYVLDSVITVSASALSLSRALNVIGVGLLLPDGSLDRRITKFNVSWAAETSPPSSSTQFTLSFIKTEFNCTAVGKSVGVFITVAGQTSSMVPVSSPITVGLAAPVLFASSIPISTSTTLLTVEGIGFPSSSQDLSVKLFSSGSGVPPTISSMTPTCQSLALQLTALDSSIIGQTLSVNITRVSSGASTPAVVVSSAITGSPPTITENTNRGIVVGDTTLVIQGTGFSLYSEQNKVTLTGNPSGLNIPTMVMSATATSLTLAMNSPLPYTLTGDTLMASVTIVRSSLSSGAAVRVSAPVQPATFASPPTIVFSTVEAGSTGSVTVSFATSMAWPGGSGSAFILVLPQEFPTPPGAVDGSGFSVSLIANAVSTPATIYYSSSTGFTVTRGALTSTLAAGSAVSVRIDGVKNPGYAGLTSKFRQVSLYTSGKPVNTIEDSFYSASQPNGVTINPATLQGPVNVTLSSRRISDVSDLQIQFTLKNALSAGSKISFIPSRELQLMSSTVTATFTGNPSVTATIALDRTITVPLPTNVTFTAGSAITLSLSAAVRNPDRVLSLSPFSLIQTMTASGGLVDVNATGSYNLSSIIQGGFASDPSVSLASNAAGDVTSMSFSVTLGHQLPGGGTPGYLLLTLPSSFGYNAGSLSLSSSNGWPSGQSVQVVAVTTSSPIRLKVQCFLSCGSEIPAGTQLSWVINGIKNSPVSGTTAPFARFASYSGDDFLIDEILNPSNTAMNIGSGTMLASPTASISATEAGLPVLVTLGLKLRNPVPTNGKILISMPSELVFPTGTLTISQLFISQTSKPASVFTLTSASPNVTFTTTVDLPEQCAVTLMLGSFTLSPGLTQTGAFTRVDSYHPSGAVIDSQTTNLPGSFSITPGSFKTLSFVPTFTMVGGTGPLNISFNSNNPIPAQGVLTLGLPTGFSLPLSLSDLSISATGAIGPFTASESSGNLIFTRQSSSTGSGAAGITYSISISCSSACFRNSDTAGSYTFPLFRIAASTGAVIDEVSSTYNPLKRPSVVISPAVGISAVSLPTGTLSTAGGDDIELTVINLSNTFLDSYRLSYGNTATPGVPSSYPYSTTDCNIRSSTAVRCRAMAGIGNAMSFIFTIGGGVYSSPFASQISYSPPTITSMTPLTGFATASGDSSPTVITIIGTNFGPAGTSVSAKYAAGNGYTGYGSNYTASSCSVTADHQRMSCTLPYGVGGNHAWQVTVNDQTSAWSSQRTSYQRPAISSVTISSGGSPTIASTGGTEVKIQGTNFGPAVSVNNVSALIIASGSPVTMSGSGIIPTQNYSAYGCSVTSSGTEIRCRVAAGVGSSLRWEVGVANQNTSTPFSSTLQFTAVTLSSVSIDAGKNHFSLSPYGNERLIFRGSGFGPLNVSSSMIYAYSTTSPYARSQSEAYTSLTSTCSVTTADTEATCFTASGIGKNKTWTLVIGGLSSSASIETFSFSPPQITTITPPTIPTTGLVAINIIGNNFGPADGSVIPTITYYSTTAGVTSIVYRLTSPTCSIAAPQTLIICTSAVEGVGKDLTWTVSIGNQTSVASTPGLTRYDSPLISGLTSSALSTSGSTVVIIDGNNFGPSGTSVVVTYGNSKLTGYAGRTYTAQECIIIVAHRQLYCKAGVGVGTGMAWNVTVANQTSPPSTAMTSYSAPMITQVSLSTLNTLGGEQIEISGANFGPVDSSNSVRVFYRSSSASFPLELEATSCTVTRDHDTIKCTTVAGVGSAFTWKAQAGEQNGTYMGPSVSYAIPTIFQVIPERFPLDTAGGEKVIIRGSGFGPSFIPASYRSITYEPDSSLTGAWVHTYQPSCTLKSADSVLECVTKPGIGTSMHWSVSVAGLSTGCCFGNSTDYMAPSISAIYTYGLLNTSGHELVNITGRYFGPPNVSYNTPSALYRSWNQAAFPASSLVAKNYSGLSCTTTSDTLISCYSDVGVGATHNWTVTVGNQASPPSAVSTSYNVPVITQINPLIMNTAGADVITIGGKNFGPVSTGESTNDVSAVYVSSNAVSPYAQKTFIASSCQVTRDHTEIQCTSLPGVGKGFQWRVTVGNQTSELSTTTTAYALPSITGFSDDTRQLDTSGGQTISILGTSFGPVDADNVVRASLRSDLPAAMRGAFLDASDCIVTVADVLLTCRVPAGVGTSFRWNITVGDQGSAQSAQTTAYLPPTLSAINGSTQTSGLILRTSGNQQVVLTGLHFGPADERNAVTARFQNQALEGATPPSNELDAASLAAVNCSVVNDTMINCLTPEGVGLNQSWTVTVGGQESSWSVFSTSYAPPVLSMLVPVQAPMPARGGTAVTITGSSLGPNDSRNVIRAFYVNENVSGASSSLLEAAEYQASCYVLAADTQIACITVAGVGINQRWRIVVGGQTSGFSTNRTSYLPPSILNASAFTQSPSNGFLTSGGSTVTIHGVDFGPVSDINVVTAQFSNPSLTGIAGRLYAAYNCLVTVLDTSIVCSVPEGIGTNQTWQVTVGGQQSALSVEGTSYAPPQISRITANPLDTRGGDQITLIGTNFGIVSDDNPVTADYQNLNLVGYARSLFEATNCRVSVSHSSIVCTTIAGVGQFLKWSVTVGGQKGPRSDVFTAYKKPSIVQIQPLPPAYLDTTGGTVVTITGDNFGRALDSNVVTATFQNSSSGRDGISGMQFTGQNCSVTIDHRVMECIAPPGVGGLHQWKVLVGGQTNDYNSAKPTSYHPPAIQSISGISNLRMGTMGGETVTITGRYFGFTSDTVITSGRDTYNNSVTTAYTNKDNYTLFTSSAQNNLSSAQLSLLNSGSNQTYSGLFCAVTVYDTEVQCQTSPGVGYNFSWSVSVAKQTSPVSDQLAGYKAPVISNISPEVGPAQGGYTISLFGQDFGDPPKGLIRHKALYLTMNGTICSNTDCPVSSQNSTQISFRLPARTPAGAAALGIWVGGQQSNEVLFQVYRVSSIYPRFGPIRGTTRVQITGVNLQNTSATQVAVLSSSNGYCIYQNSSLIYWISGSVPTRTGEVRLNFTQNGRDWTLIPDAFIYYEPPLLAALDVQLGPVDGGTAITATGLFFDTSVVRAKFGTVITDCTLLRNTQVSCTSPPQLTNGLTNVSVTVDTNDTLSDPLFTDYSASNQFYYHRRVYETSGPYPHTIPSIGAQTMALWVYPDDLMKFVTPPQLSLMTVKMDNGEEAAVLREALIVYSIFWDPSNISFPAEFVDKVLSVAVNTKSQVDQQNLGQDCGGLTIYSDDHATALPFWMPPGECNKENSTIFLRIPGRHIATTSVMNISLAFSASQSLSGGSDGASVFQSSRNPSQYWFANSFAFEGTFRGVNSRYNRNWILPRAAIAALSATSPQLVITAPAVYEVLAGSRAAFTQNIILRSRWAPIAVNTEQILMLSPRQDAVFMGSSSYFQSNVLTIRWGRISTGWTIKISYSDITSSGSSYAIQSSCPVDFSQSLAVSLLISADSLSTLSIGSNCSESFTFPETLDPFYLYVGGSCLRNGTSSTTCSVPTVDWISIQPYDSQQPSGYSWMNPDKEIWRLSYATAARPLNTSTFQLSLNGQVPRNGLSPNTSQYTSSLSLGYDNGSIFDLPTFSFSKSGIFLPPFSGFVDKLGPRRTFYADFEASALIIKDIDSLVDIPDLLVSSTGLQTGWQCPTNVLNAFALCAEDEEQWCQGVLQDMSQCRHRLDCVDNFLTDISDRVSGFRRALCRLRACAPFDMMQSRGISQANADFGFGFSSNSFPLSILVSASLCANAPIVHVRAGGLVLPCTHPIPGGTTSVDSKNSLVCVLSDKMLSYQEAALDTAGMAIASGLQFLEISVNGLHFTRLNQRLELRRPRVSFETSLSGPISGGTDILLTLNMIGITSIQEHLGVGQRTNGSFLLPEFEESFVPTLSFARSTDLQLFQMNAVRAWSYQIINDTSVSLRFQTPATGGLRATGESFVCANAGNQSSDDSSSSVCKPGAVLDSVACPLVAFPCFQSEPNDCNAGYCHAPIDVESEWYDFDEGYYDLFLQSHPEDGFLALSPTAASTNNNGVAQFYFYDSLTAFDQLPSPLNAPIVKSSTDVKTNITFRGTAMSPLMRPTLQMRTKNATVTSTGYSVIHSAPLLTDMAPLSQTKAPLLHLGGIHMQTIVLGTELMDAGLYTADSITAIQLRMRGTPKFNIFNVFLKVKWINVVSTSSVVDLKSNMSSPLMNTTFGTRTSATETTGFETVHGPGLIQVGQVADYGEYLTLALNSSIELPSDLTKKALVIDLLYETPFSDATAASNWYYHETLGQYRTYWEANLLPEDSPSQAGNLSFLALSNTSSTYSCQLSSSTSTSGDKGFCLGQFVPFFTFITNRVKLSIPMPSGIVLEDKTQPLQMDFAPNGQQFIQEELQKSPSRVIVGFSMIGVSNSNFSDPIFVADFKNALVASSNGLLGTENIVLDASPTKPAASETSRRRLADSGASAAQIRVIIVSSSSLPFDSSTIPQITSVMTVSLERGALVQQLTALGYSTVSISQDSITVTQQDPQSSIFYSNNALMFQVFDTIKLSSVSPSSGPQEGCPLGSTYSVSDTEALKILDACRALDKLVKIGGVNFQIPLSRDSSRPGNLAYVKWYLTRDLQSFIVTIGQVFQDEYNATYIETWPPPFPDDKGDMATQGYATAVISVSFNGNTYTDPSLGLNRIFFKSPKIISVDPLQAPQSGVCDTRTEIGNCKKEDDLVYITINGTNIFKRRKKLKCVFLQEDSNFTLAEAVIDKEEFVTSAIFKCAMPALDAGTLYVTFSNNEGLDWAVPISVSSSASSASSSTSTAVTLYPSLTSVACPLGFVAPTAKSKCTQCKPGQYQSSTSACKNCDLNYYSESYGAQKCISCPPNSKTLTMGSGSRYLCVCETGFYNKSQDASASRPCETCIEDSICPGERSLPYPIQGYWTNISAEAVTAESFSMLRCSPSTACMGGPNSECKHGYTGERCSACASAFYRISHYCTSCPSEGLATAFFPVQIFMYAVAIMIFGWQIDNISKISSLIILWRFVQITYLISFFELSWQGGFSETFDVSSGVLLKTNTDLYSTEFFSAFSSLSVWMPFFFYPDFQQTAALFCTLWPWWSSYLFSFLTPLGFVSLLYLKWIAVHRPQWSFGKFLAASRSSWETLVALEHPQQYLLKSSMNVDVAHLHERLTSEVEETDDIARGKESPSKKPSKDESSTGGPRESSMLAPAAGNDDEEPNRVLSHSPRKRSLLRADLEELGALNPAHAGSGPLPGSSHMLAGAKALTRLQAVVGGIIIMLFPFWFRSLLRAIACDEETTIAYLCVINLERKIELILAAVLTVGIFLLGILFLDSTATSAWVRFLTKNKTPSKKKWEFIIQMRTATLVFANFVSENGVFQAGLALTVCLIYLVAHSWIHPYKDARSNRLETLCMVSNITMLFIGIICSIGSLPSAFSAHVVQYGGYALFVATILLGLYYSIMETYDRIALNAAKRGGGGLAGSGTSVSTYIARNFLPNALARRSKFVQQLRKDISDEALVKFVGLLLDVVLPLDRSGQKVFTVDEHGQKTLPLDGIRNVLLSHAALKRQLKDVNSVIFHHWVHLKTQVLYLSQFMEDQLEEHQKVELRQKLKTILVYRPSVITTIFRMATFQNWRRNAALYQGQRSMKDRQTHVWIHLRQKLLDAYCEGSDEAAAVEMGNIVAQFQSRWEGEVGTATEKDPDFWFDWHSEAKKLEDRLVVTRVELLLDWMSNPYADLTLISSMQRAVGMLSAEYKNMIDMSKSQLVSVYSVLSASRTVQRVSVASKRPCGRILSTCFAGDILQVQVSLKNCFNHTILIPNKKTAWDAFVTVEGRSRQSSAPKTRALEVLRCFATDGGNTVMEFSVPRDVRQGIYRLELFAYMRKIHWASVSLGIFGAVEKGSTLVNVRQFQRKESREERAVETVDVGPVPSPVVVGDYIRFIPRRGRQMQKGNEIKEVPKEEKQDGASVDPKEEDEDIGEDAVDGSGEEDSGEYLVTEVDTAMGHITLERRYKGQSWTNCEILLVKSNRHLLVVQRELRATQQRDGRPDAVVLYRDDVLRASTFNDNVIRFVLFPTLRSIWVHGIRFRLSLLWQAREYDASGLRTKKNWKEAAFLEFSLIAGEDSPGSHEILLHSKVIMKMKRIERHLSSMVQSSNPLRAEAELPAGVRESATIPAGQGDVNKGEESQTLQNDVITPADSSEFAEEAKEALDEGITTIIREISEKNLAEEHYHGISDVRIGIVPDCSNIVKVGLQLGQEAADMFRVQVFILGLGDDDIPLTKDKSNMWGAADYIEVYEKIEEVPSPGVITVQSSYTAQDKGGEASNSSDKAETPSTDKIESTEEEAVVSPADSSK